MDLKKHTEEIKASDQLIELKCTESPDDLDSRFEISKKCLYEYLDYMEEFGTPIVYSRSNKTFMYTHHAGSTEFNQDDTHEQETNESNIRREKFILANPFSIEIVQGSFVGL